MKTALWAFIIALLLALTSCRNSFTDVGKAQIDSLFYRLRIADTLQQGLDTTYLQKQITQASLNIQNFQIYFNDTLSGPEAEFLIGYYKNIERMKFCLELNREQLSAITIAQKQLAALKADLIRQVITPNRFMTLFASESQRCSVLYANAFSTRKEVQISVNSQIRLTQELQKMMDNKTQSVE